VPMAVECLRERCQNDFPLERQPERLFMRRNRARNRKSPQFKPGACALGPKNGAETVPFGPACQVVQWIRGRSTSTRIEIVRAFGEGEYVSQI
jgi:hypothetical protein